MTHALKATDDAGILRQLESIIHELFNDYDGSVTDALTADDVDQWDSLGHIQLIVMIEQVWSIKFSNEEATTLANLGELIAMIKAKTAA